MVYADFTASPTENVILLEWWTESEIDNLGFYLQRSLRETGPYQRITPFIATDSDGIHITYYFWFDDTVVAGTVYYYRLESVNEQGISAYYGPVAASTSGVIIPATLTPTSSVTLGSTSVIPTDSVAALSQTPTPTGFSPSTLATLTGTLIATQATPTETPTPHGSASPTATTTLEPLPKIELTFPPTETHPPFTPTIVKSTKNTSTPTSQEPVLVRAPVRLTTLGLVVVALWVCLGVFLVYIVRQLIE